MIFYIICLKTMSILQKTTYGVFKQLALTKIFYKKREL